LKAADQKTPLLLVDRQRAGEWITLNHTVGHPRIDLGRLCFAQLRRLATVTLWIEQRFQLGGLFALLHFDKAGRCWVILGKVKQIAP
jgi:hypothetical protein